VDWSIPADITVLLQTIDDFIDRELVPLQQANPDLFDHRREFTRTDVERGGIPTRRWHELLDRARRLSIEAGLYQYPFPRALGGGDGSNLAMAIIREHLAHRGPGLHAELSHEASVVANEPLVLVLHEYGTPEQQRRYLEPLVDGRLVIAFALTEPDHGSDATWLTTRARVAPDGGWILDGVKRYITGIDVAGAVLVFARTSGQDGKAQGISAFLVDVPTPGLDVPYYHWCLNMPTDHGELVLDGVHVGDDALIGELDRGLDCAQLFVHENRIRQAASSLGAAQFCIDRSIDYARERVIFGRPLADYQGIQWQLVELQTEAELVRNTLYKTAWLMDEQGGGSTSAKLSVTERVSMVNYRANRLACDAADRAMQVYGGMGYTRALPFEFIYRHHRRYRITEGSDELQLRRIAGRLFGFTGRPL
jgi:alkylation response protein AidB-like acyl-CoA dehydrogenase